MAVSVEAKIIDGLCSHFAGLSLSGIAAVAYPNVTFTPPVDGTEPQPYVRLTIAKNTPVNTSISGGQEPIRQGLLLATVCWPVGTGLIAASEVAATIRSAFAFNTSISYQSIQIRITGEPDVKGDIQGDIYTEIPIVIPWSVYPA